MSATVNLESLVPLGILATGALYLFAVFITSHILEKKPCELTREYSTVSELEPEIEQGDSTPFSWSSFYRVIIGYLLFGWCVILFTILLNSSIVKINLAPIINSMSMALSLLAGFFFVHSIHESHRTQIHRNVPFYLCGMALIPTIILVAYNFSYLKQTILQLTTT